MLDKRFIKENTEEVTARLATRGEAPDMEGFLRLEREYNTRLREVESLKYTSNTVSGRIAALKREKKDASRLIGKMQEVSARIKSLEESLREMEGGVNRRLLDFPNLPHSSVPVGRDERDNPELKRWGEPPQFTFHPRSHVELGEKLGILDFERAAKITGARFCLYKGAGALLERALINFMLDLHTREHGYTEVLPPFMVNESSMTGTGQLPKFAEDLFKMADDPYYLVPTAEVPVTNIHRNEILEEERLPLRYTAHTPCFRREAGSYGKDTRGLIRQHQFNKVELVKFSRPEDSYSELEKLLADAERVLRLLQIPYRVVTLCTGDLGFSAAKTYDIEAWVPSQECYREISSCSNFEDFQARRAAIRCRSREGKGKPRLVHTLNGSGLAVGRTLVALLENYQEADGSVSLPAALLPYTGGLERLV